MDLICMSLKLSKSSVKNNKIKEGSKINAELPILFLKKLLINQRNSSFIFYFQILDMLSLFLSIPVKLWKDY
jgi:hypothetical protein